MLSSRIPFAEKVKAFRLLKSESKTHLVVAFEMGNKNAAYIFFEIRTVLISKTVLSKKVFSRIIFQTTNELFHHKFQNATILRFKINTVVVS